MTPRSSVLIFSFTVILAVLTGCISQHAAADIGTNGRIGGALELEAALVTPSALITVGAVARVRAGKPFFDTGLGLSTCVVSLSRWAGCVRVFPLELGSYEGNTSIGLMSPSLRFSKSFALLRPRVDPSNSEERRSVHSFLLLEAGGGFDVRPLNDWAGTTPYVTVGLGYYFLGKRD